MRRSLIGLVLGAALMLFASACGSRPAVETKSINGEDPGSDTAATGVTVPQGSESGAKPLVSVSRSPT